MSTERVEKGRQRFVDTCSKWGLKMPKARKKVNPRRKPATAADVERAKRQAQSFAIEAVWAMFFTVMRDKEGYGPVRLKRIWNEVEELSDSINQGYVKVLDLVRTLEEEAGIVLR